MLMSVVGIGYFSFVQHRRKMKDFNWGEVRCVRIEVNNLNWFIVLCKVL